MALFRSGNPAISRTLSVGPFSTSPSTNGLTATTGARASFSASVIPGTARIGPIEMTGFDGPITIASAAAIASRTSRRRPCVLDPAQLDRLSAPAARSLIMNSWNGCQSPLRLHPGADRLVAHRQHAVRRPRAPAPPLRAPPSGARRRPARCASEHIARSRSPRLNQMPSPASRRRVHRLPGVALDAPAALVDHARQPVRDEVGVGGDVHAVDARVVAGVGDHVSSSGPTTSYIPRASFAPPVPPARTTTKARRASPVKLMPACVL